MGSIFLDVSSLRAHTPWLMPVPTVRIRTLADAPVREGAYVLYWMIAARRSSHSFALDRALELCRETGKPLLVFEPLRVGYRWASDRLHAFVIDGMRDQQAAFTRAGVTYFPYLEPRRGEGDHSGRWRRSHDLHDHRRPSSAAADPAGGSISLPA